VSLPDLAGLLRALVAAGVEFVVVGGVAVAVHAYVRATEDVDLVPKPDHDNLDRLVNVLVTLDARLALDPTRALGPDERRALRMGRNLSVATRLGDLDILQRLSGVPSFETLSKDSSGVVVAGSRVMVCSREHLMAMKRARSSSIDLADLEQLGMTQ
jgi:hypothetical protein